MGFFLLAYIFDLGASYTCIFEIKRRPFAIMGDRVNVTGLCKDRNCGSLAVF